MNTKMPLKTENISTEESMVQRCLNKEMYVCKSVYWSRQHSPEHGCDLNIFSAVKVTLASGASNY